MTVPLKARVLLADDHALLRQGLRLILDAQPDFEVVDDVADGAAAVARALEEDVDLAILDVSMPRLTGLQAAQELSRRRPELRLLILSMHDREQYFFEALRAGASGYVLKDAPPGEVVDAIRRVAQGGIIVSSGAAEAVRVRLGHLIEVDGLTERETELLRLVSHGLDNTEIAQRLYLSPKTVRNRLSELYAKLGVRSRAEAVARARNASIQ